MALTLLRDYFAEKHIRFALVGALVPALLLSSEVGSRETRDADHVITLASWAEWDAVIADLVKLGFTRGRGEDEHRLYYRTAEIDLIPYGITNGPGEVLIWRKSGNRMNMTGFSDVFRYAKPTEVTKGLTLPVVPLWLFAVLKVIAYLDRAFPRDLSDLIYVLECYESSGDESRRFEIASGIEGVTYDTSGAYLLGRDVRENAWDKATALVEGFVAVLLKKFSVALADESRQQAGYTLEDILADLFGLFEIEYTKSVKTPTQQIDGHFNFDSFDYLVEVRWRKDKPAAQEIAGFKHKVETKLESTRGLFLAVQGIREEVINDFKGRNCNVLFMDGSDLVFLLEGRMDLGDALRLKREKAAQLGEPFWPLSLIYEGKIN